MEEYNVTRPYLTGVQEVSLVETAATVYELVKKGASIEVQEQLMKLREEALSSQGEVLDLRQRITDLEAQAALNEQMEFDGSSYWRSVDGKREGPFCQQCFDNEHKSIRLQQHESARQAGRTVKWWGCRTCKSEYK